MRPANRYSFPRGASCPFTPRPRDRRDAAPSELGEPLVLASDGALTAEHILAAIDGGVTAVIHPGGASEDRDAAEAADARGVTLVSTGVRHFRH